MSRSSGVIPPRFYAGTATGSWEVNGKLQRDRQAPTAHPSDNTSACSNTVIVAFSCLSGG